jgi:hypothetical protein
VFITLALRDSKYILATVNDLTGKTTVNTLAVHQARMMGMFATQVIKGYYDKGYRYTFNNYTDIRAGLAPINQDH